MYRIFLIEQHPVTRLGLATLIQDQNCLELCGESDSAREALLVIPGASPDLIVTEIALPDMSGLELIKELQTRSPEVPVLVVSAHDELLYAERVIKAGGRGFVPKTEPNAVLVEAMRQTAKGDMFLTPSITNHLLRTMAGNGNRPDSKLPTLSDRELEVFELIGLGKSTHDIADQLCICIHTVEAHRTHIREKLGLSNAAGVIRQAVMWVEFSNGSGLSAGVR